ncbi:MAG: LpxD N-terminal domain-containing protein, partial [Flavobacteriales bacterium]
MNYTSEEIANILEGTVVGNHNETVHSIAKIEEGKEGDLCFLSNPKYNSYLYSCKA